MLLFVLVLSVATVSTTSVVASITATATIVLAAAAATITACMFGYQLPALSVDLVPPHRPFQQTDGIG